MSIKHWPVTERPREKALQHGVATLSDAELLALFLRTGIVGKDALSLAREWLVMHHNLANILALDFASAKKLPGLGAAKFVELQAALELGRRYLQNELQRGTALDKPAAVANWLKLKLRAEKTEVFVMLSLNLQNHLIAYDEVARGTSSFVPIRPRTVVQIALQHKAERVIIAHNHPSGAREPSTPDIDITRKIQAALKLVQIDLLDHFLIGDGEPVSLRALGVMEN